LPYEIAVGFQKSGIWKQGYKLVLIGLKDETPYAKQIKALSGTEGVEVFPANYDPVVLAALRESAFCYMHGNSVGGTNPALLEAMQSCKRVFAIEGPFSREVLGACGKLFTVDKLAEQFHESLAMEDQNAGMNRRLRESYNWDAVAASYYNLLKGKPAAYRGSLEDSLAQSGSREPQVGVIIVNYNGAGDTMECIESIMKMSYSNMKLYVVDNCSPNGSGRQLSHYIGKLDPARIEFIQLERNVGFSGGNNVAIRQAMDEGAELLWLINNDTVVHPDALGRLVETMKSNPDLGIAGSKIYFYGTKKIWFAGGVINKFGMSSHDGYLKEDADGSLYAEGGEVGYITGCSLLARRKMINQIGVLDEDFFLYYEDTEFCRRAIRFGWKVYYEPKSVVWHKVSASTKSKLNDHSPALDYYDIRNSIIYIRKCYAPMNRLVPYIGVCIKFAKKHVRLVVRPESRKLEKLKIIYRGLNDAIVNKHGSL
jgi:GT2 family glycosyltransferase